MDAMDPASTPKPKIRLLIVDDHPVVVKGIASYVSEYPGIEVVGEAYDGDDAIEQTLLLKPDVILMDFNMPGLDGLEAIKLLRTKVEDPKILVFTMSDDKDIILRLVHAGAQGYLMKNAFHRELIDAITAINNGKLYLGEDISQTLLQEYLRKAAPSSEISFVDSKSLTMRERHVLAMIADGFKNKQIAERLDLNTRTVEAHRDRLRRKLGISSAAGLTKYCLDNNISMATEAESIDSKPEKKKKKRKKRKKKTTAATTKKNSAASLTPDAPAPTRKTAKPKPAQAANTEITLGNASDEASL